MTAIVLPDIDRKTIDELLSKLPDLKEIELPSMDQVGKTAEQQIDRLLGRSKAPVWPWVAAGIGLVALIGAAAAYFAFWRRPAWDSTDESWATPSATTDDETGSGVAIADLTDQGAGLTAAESSLTSTGYNPQDS